VFDCGGDPVGAAALGGLKTYFDELRPETEVLFVINTRRPFQGSTEKLEESLTRIQMRARLNADGLVLNANLGPESTGEELSEGYSIVKALSDKTGVPIRYVSGTSAALEEFDKQCPDCGGERVALNIYTRPEWME